jgi:hypothetical protein
MSVAMAKLLLLVLTPAVVISVVVVPSLVAFVVVSVAQRSSKPRHWPSSSSLLAAALHTAVLHAAAAVQRDLATITVAAVVVVAGAAQAGGRQRAGGWAAAGGWRLAFPPIANVAGAATPPPAVLRVRPQPLHLALLFARKRCFPHFLLLHFLLGQTSAAVAVSVDMVARYERRGHASSRRVYTACRRDHADLTVVAAVFFLK